MLQGGADVMAGAAGAPALMLAGGGPALLEGPGGAARLASQGEGVAGGAAGGNGQLAIADDGQMIDMANVEGQLRASSIRRVAELVEKHPEASLGIVRSWMQRELA
jgi:flagellar M-ring protein FliF